MVEDDQADPRTGAIVAQRLVDARVSGVVGHFNSGVSIPASKIYADAGIPQLSVSTAVRYTRQGHATAFRLMALMRVGVVSPDPAGSRALSRAQGSGFEHPSSIGTNAG